MNETTVADQLNWAARLLARETETMLGPHWAQSCLCAGSPSAFLAGGAHTPKGPAEAASVEQPTTTATIQRMERDGLVTRKRNPDDDRSALIALTAAGYDRIADMDRALGALNELLLEQFTTAERGQFLELLGRVISVPEVQTGRVGRRKAGPQTVDRERTPRIENSGFGKVSPGR